MGVVDTAMLGRFDDEALAGAGIANGLLFSISVLGMGIIMGMDALVPQSVGANERSRTRALLGAGLRLSFRVGLPLTIVCAASPLLLGPSGVNPEIIDDATVYVWARLPAIIPLLLFAGCRSFLQAHAVTRPLIISVVIGNVLNFGLNALLVFGDNGLISVGLPPVGIPALGVIGASIATSIVSVITLVIVLIATRELARQMPSDADKETGLARRARLEKQIFSIGLPIGLQLTAEVGIFALVAVLAGRLGTLPAAGHQIALTIASLTFSVVLGLSSAASVRVGIGVGAGDTPAARRAGFCSLGLGGAVMTTSALAFLLIPAPLARLFTTDPEVLAASVPLLRIAALFQLSDGAQAIAAGALRGAGDTRSTFVANLLGHYVIGLSVALTFTFVLDMGARGLWWGLSAGLTATAILLVTRFVWLSARPIAAQAIGD